MRHSMRSRPAVLLTMAVIFQALLILGCSSKSSSTKPLSGPSISVESPQGNAHWFKQLPYTIRWSSDQITGNVKIQLSRDSGHNWPYTITPGTTNLGEFLWTVSYDAAPTYRMRVSSVEDPTVFGDSPDFTIQTYHWTQHDILNTLYFAAIAFVGDEGWAAGYQAIMHKAAGDTAWILQPGGENVQSQDISFADPAHGWAVGIEGDHGAVLYTSTSGATWQHQQIPSAETLSGVFALSPTLAWAVGNHGVILQTTNGGTTWHSQTPAVATLLTTVCFADPLTGWAAGYDGHIEHTTNGGASWVLQRQPNPNSLLWGIACLDQNIAFATTRSGSVLKTTNGGANWTETNAGLSVPLYNIATVDAHTIYSCGQNGTVVQSVDGGEHWGSFGVTTEGNYLYDLAVSSTGKVWIAAQHGVLYEGNLVDSE
jgi:photosystem II stability/assembly factor-like uncharacterized protein